MKEPNPINTPHSSKRYKSWVDDFGSYRINVNEGRIERWIGQFEQNDRDTAARILDCVHFINIQQISASFRDILQALPGWNIVDGERTGNWFFCSFSISGGESGDQMLSVFRTANNLSSKKHNRLFPFKRDLFNLAPGSEDTVVFVDDFAGTGNQACQGWQESFQELLPYGCRIFLILVAASESALVRIGNETEMVPVCNIRLSNSDSIFHDDCKHFSTREKRRILHYCRIADNQNPQGYGNCGFVIVFSHKCPNNSIPVLHRSNEQWEGLFRRY